MDENRQRLPSYCGVEGADEPGARSASPGRAARAGLPPASARRSSGVPLTELPSYELRGYRLEWEARDHDRTLLASGSARTCP